MSVLVSDDSNFNEILKDNSRVVVKYYADWCGTCRLFSPKYKRVSEEERFNGIVFLDINAEKNPEARKAGNVKNLPTFAIFKDGQLVEALCSSKEEAVTELIQKLKS